MEKNSNVHFVGIKGVGMTPLAIIVKQAGFGVTGSDTSDTFITDVSLAKEDIVPFVGFDPSHIHDVDLVITTGAHGGYSNVEVIEAKRREIPVLSQGEAVGQFMKGEIFGREHIGISVFGSHGKTTTTAMTATIFKDAGVDPSYVIGTSMIPSLGESGHFGNGTYFIAEADEYATEPVADKTPKLLWQHPKIAICTNIELDHPDLYASVDAVIAVFKQFISQLPNDGVLICCGDDPKVLRMLEGFSGKKITYGFGTENDVIVRDVITENNHTSFTIYEQEKLMGTFTVGVVGRHNALNATAAILAAQNCGLAIDQVQKGIASFSGSKRRLEYKGVLANGVVCFDDYGHHPTEIATTLTALRQSNPEKTIICIFQPHTYSRTKALFDEFSHAFIAADSLILLDIYASAREAVDTSVSSIDLASRVNENGTKTEYLPRPIDVVKYLKENSFDSDTLIVSMGAGDVYTIWDQIDLLHK